MQVLIALYIIKEAQSIRSDTERSKSFVIEFVADKVSAIKSVLNVFMVIITS